MELRDNGSDRPDRGDPPASRRGDAVPVLLAVQGGYWVVMSALAIANELRPTAFLFTGALAVVSLVLAKKPRRGQAAVRTLTLALEVVVAGLGALALLTLTVFQLQPEDGPVSTTLLLVLGSLGGCGGIAAMTCWYLRPTTRPTSLP